jgi:hypothetical protein
MLENSSRMIKEQCEKFPRLKDRIIHSFLGAADHMNEYPRLTKDLVQATFMNYSFDSTHDEDPAKNVVRHALMKVIQEGKDNQEIRSDYSMTFLSNMVFGVMNSVIVSWLNNTEGFQLKKEMEQAATFIVEAISS